MMYQVTRKSDSLAHYASEYYDPVKAHEYYEAHKKLKGRKSTAGLNDAGKEAAAYIKDRLDTESHQKIDSHSEQTSKQIESNTETTKSVIESHKEQMQSHIDSLRNKLKSMSSSQKAAARDSIQAQIDRLRDNNSKVRARLQESNRSKNTGLKDAHRKFTNDTKAEYDEKYMKELDGLKGQSEFTTKKKKSSRGG